MYNRAGPTVSVQQYQLQRKYSIRDDQIDQKALPTSSNLAIHRIQHQQSLPPLPTQPATTNAQIRLAPNVLNSTNNKRWQTLKRSTAIITTLPQSASVDTPLWPDNQQQYQSGKNKRLLTRSNSQEVIEEEPSKPTPHLRDVIFSLRRYSDSWFKEVSVKHPEIFVDSANYANFARTQHNLKTTRQFNKPLVGFQASQTVFLDDQRLITCVGRFLCQIDLTDCRDERTIVDMNSKIMSLEVSTKFDILAVCVDFRRGSTVFIKETEDITKTRNSFLVGLLANQICITPNGQFLLLLEIEPDRRTARISIHNLIDGKQYAEAKFDLKIPSKIFEMSLCPADEDVICLLTDDCIRLLRITPGVISTFSTAKVFNFTCHTWCDDVTLAFGTTDGRLALYRETLALETIDLGKMHNSLIADAQQANRASVVRMHSSDQGLLVCVEIGVVFLFPPLDEDDKQARWHNSKAIVIESLSSTLCHRLSIEPSGNHIIYTDQQCIWLCNIQYAESVCRKGMRLITAQHHRPIKQLAVDIIESEVCASLDTSGTVIVTSNTSK
ncbi:hypothetical protein M3Y97_00502100 [Aphelenchoides bicaudatus]|nr:hypothetical protein M3Y97_00502100 [Aphelenchoides bicaudatus]